MEVGFELPGGVRCGDGIVMCVIEGGGGCMHVCMYACM